MRNVDHRCTQLLMQPRKLVPHPRTQVGVEIGQRLVEQQHLRPPHHRARDRDPLALPARQGTRPPVEQFRQIEHRRDLSDPLGDFALGHLRNLQRKRDILGSRQMRIERIGLEHHRQPPVRRRRIGYVAPSDRYPPRARHLQSRDHPQQRRLAAPRRPDKHDELAFRDRQVSRLEYCRVAEAFEKPPDFNARHRSSFASARFGVATQTTLRKTLVARGSPRIADGAIHAPWLCRAPQNRRRTPALIVS